MKKTYSKMLRCFIIPVLCTVLLLGPLTLKAYAVNEVRARLRPDMTIIIDGVKRSFFNVNGQQVHPILYDGTTYLPVRAIGELMGKNVDWNQSTRTVTLAGNRITPVVLGILDQNPQAMDIQPLLRDDFTVIVDDTQRTFRDVNGKVVYPLLYQGSTYLPIRAIGELMGKTVSWNGDTQTVTLSQENEVTDADSFDGYVPVTSALPVQADRITLEQAKAKALAHAGLNAEQVTFTKEKLDRDDNRLVYDLEFFARNYGECEYEIDAATGDVVSYHCDSDSYTPTDSPISSARAQEIALKTVPGATASHIKKLKLDWEHGHCVYEVEILCNRKEYDLEIDAVTGAVLSFDWDDCEHYNDDYHHYDGYWHHSNHH